MTGGFGLNGLSAFVFIAVGSHTLTPEAYSSLALAWTIATIYGMVVGITAEQTVTRMVAAGARPGFARAILVRLGAASVFVLLLVPFTLAGGAGRVADATIWAGSLWIVALAWIPLAPVRGYLAGGSRFFAYAASLAIESVSRIAIAAFAVLQPGMTLWLLTAALCVPLLLAALGGLMMVPAHTILETSKDAESTSEEQYSMAAVAGLQQICLNTAPLFLHWQSPIASAAGDFVSATTYMRIPLILAMGLVTIVLSGASRSYGAGDFAAMLRWIGLGLATALLFAGSAVIVLVAASDVAIPVLFGRDVVESEALLGWLALGTVATVSSLMMTQIVYGTGRASLAVAVWIGPSLLTALGLASADASAVRMAMVIAVGQMLATVLLIGATIFVLRAASPGSRWPVARWRAGQFSKREQRN